VGRSGDDDAARAYRLLAGISPGTDDEPSIVAPFERHRTRVQPHVLELRADRVGERLHALRERKAARRVPAARLRLRPRAAYFDLAPDETPVGLLERVQ